MIISLILIVVLIDTLVIVAQHLPMCSMQGDTYGEWKSVNEIEQSMLSLKEYERHFFGGGPGEAIEFTNVWIPRDCSMHRFTNASLHLAVEYMHRKLNYTDDKFIHWIIMGDSATRGIICGLTRLFAGSEILGPCMNNVCGNGAGVNPASVSSYGKYIDLDFTPHFRLTFVYIQSFDTRHLDWLLEFALTIMKPALFMFNTGAWDYDEIARAHSEPAAEYCNSNETEAVSIKRSSTFVNTTLSWLGAAAKENQVRTIYRNNHYNNRFGVHCADDRLEEMLKGSPWEILDSRRISQGSYIHQDWDGFHFDRFKVYWEETHLATYNWYKSHSLEIPGQLEMQLTQSFLNMAFYDALEHIQVNHKPSQYRKRNFENITFAKY